MTDCEIKYSTFVVEGGMGLYINGGAPEVCARLEFAFAPTYPECVFRTLHLELQFNWTQESALRLSPPPRILPMYVQLAISCRLMGAVPVSTCIHSATQIIHQH